VPTRILASGERSPCVLPDPTPTRGICRLGWRMWTCPRPETSTGLRRCILRQTSALSIRAAESRHVAPAVGQMTLSMTPEAQQQEFSPEPQLLMGAAAVSVFAYLFAPVGFLVVLILPGALVATSLAYLHGLTRWRRLAVVVYGATANCCLFPLCAGGLATISIYAGLASLGLAALCIESRLGSELSASHAGAAVLVGAASSLPLSLMLTLSGADFGLFTLGVVGQILVWPQYFLHSRYLVAQTRPPS
jgi:hypothetical protein